MLHPVFTVLLRQPELLMEHAAGYAALLREETQATAGQVAGRAMAWAIAVLGFLLLLRRTARVGQGRSGSGSGQQEGQGESGTTRHGSRPHCFFLPPAGRPRRSDRACCCWACSARDFCEALAKLCQQLFTAVGFAA